MTALRQNLADQVTEELSAAAVLLMPQSERWESVLVKWALRVQEAEDERAAFNEANLILKHALNAARHEAEKYAGDVVGRLMPGGPFRERYRFSWELAEQFLAHEATMITGAPGVGKTDCVADAARDVGARLIVCHPVVNDPIVYGEPALEPERDRERLAALICEWNEGDTTHQPTEEELRLADFILARLEADRGK